jgi:hypothetical protein
MTLAPGKFDDTVVSLALHVVASSAQSYLQLKAFELLAVMSRKSGLGHMPASMVDDYLESDRWPIEQREKSRIQWEAMSMRALQLEQFRKRIRNELRKPTITSFADKVCTLKPS